VVVIYLLRQLSDTWTYNHTVELKLNKVLFLFLLAMLHLQHQVLGKKLDKLNVFKK